MILSNQTLAFNNINQLILNIIIFNKLYKNGNSENDDQFSTWQFAVNIDDREIKIVIKKKNIFNL